MGHENPGYNRSLVALVPQAYRTRRGILASDDEGVNITVQYDFILHFNDIFSTSVDVYSRSSVVIFSHCLTC